MGFTVKLKSESIYVNEHTGNIVPELHIHKSTSVLLLFKLNLAKFLSKYFSEMSQFTPWGINSAIVLQF